MKKINSRYFCFIFRPKLMTLQMALFPSTRSFSREQWQNYFTTLDSYLENRSITIPVKVRIYLMMIDLLALISEYKTFSLCTYSQQEMIIDKLFNIQIQFIRKDFGEIKALTDKMITRHEK